MVGRALQEGLRPGEARRASVHRPAQPGRGGQIAYLCGRLGASWDQDQDGLIEVSVSLHYEAGQRTLQLSDLEAFEAGTRVRTRLLVGPMVSLGYGAGPEFGWLRVAAMWADSEDRWCAHQPVRQLSGWPRDRGLARWCRASLRAAVRGDARLVRAEQG